jgi:hypothetical protein
MSEGNDGTMASMAHMRPKTAGLNGAAYMDAPLFNGPPSPPATDTDTDTDTDVEADTQRRSVWPTGLQPQWAPVASTTSEPDTIPFPEFRDQLSGSRPAPELAPRPEALPVSPPISSPPYWTHSPHMRTISTSSVDSIPTGGIILRDNENSSFDDRGSACWAKSVEIVDHVIINGSATNIGAFVVWNIRVETLNGSYMNIRKRYSEFDDLRWRLVRTFPNFEAAVPELPPKSIISKFRSRFLEKRRAGLQYFLNCILLNPEFSGSPVLKEFLFS